MVKQSAKCALKCVQKYAHRFHSWEAVCPREHWGFGGAPSPQPDYPPPTCDHIRWGTGSLARGFSG